MTAEPTSSRNARKHYGVLFQLRQTPSSGSNHVSSLCQFIARSDRRHHRPSQGQVGGLTENVASALAYVTIIPAVLFLVIEPYNKNRFVRFHSFQSIFFHVAWIILWIALGIFGHLPFLGWASLLLWPLIGLAGFVIWLILVFKAYQGKTFKLPVIGDMAEKQANTV